MSTSAERVRGAPAPFAPPPDRDRDREHIQARVFLQPIAAPSVLGYFALCSALIIHGTWETGIWGTPKSPEAFFPFIFMFSGVGQLGAAMWCYKARDAVAASAHGSWAAFWLGWSTMWLLETTGTITVPPLGAHFASLGMWWMYMAVITWTVAIAALAKSPGIFLTEALLGTMAAISAAASLYGSSGWTTVAGWVSVATAAFAFYIAAAMMLDGVFGVVVLPLLKWKRTANVPGGRPLRPVQFRHGEPGVKVGQ